MSIDTLSTNPSILTDLGEALAPYFPDTGITSLTGDSNISCSVSGRDGTVALNPSISVTDISISGTLGVSGLITLNSQAGSSGQVLTSQGSSADPIWATPVDTGITNIVGDSNITCTVSGQDASVSLNSSISLTGITVSGTSAINGLITLSSDAGASGEVLTSQGASANPIWAPLSVPGLLAAGAGTAVLDRQTSLNILHVDLTGLTVGQTIFGTLTGSFYPDLPSEVFNLQAAYDSTPISTVPFYVNSVMHYSPSICFSFVATATSHTINYNVISTNVANEVNTDGNDYFSYLIMG